jgi:hypothetical protein
MAVATDGLSGRKLPFACENCCDDDAKTRGKSAAKREKRAHWTHIHPLLEVCGGDFVTTSGADLYRFLVAAGAELVLWVTFFFFFFEFVEIWCFFLAISVLFLPISRFFL